jgi:hypothetical protein
MLVADDSRQPLKSGLGPRREKRGGVGLQNTTCYSESLGTERIVDILRSLLHSSPLLCIIHLVVANDPASFAASNLFQFTDSECVFEHRD